MNASANPEPLKSPVYSFDYRDEYQRKPIAEKIIQLLESDIPLSPLMIDGSWGSGKTEFTHKLIELIESTKGEQFLPIYIDAFAADHADNPLMTLLAAIAKHSGEDDKNRLFESAKPLLRLAGGTIAKTALHYTFGPWINIALGTASKLVNDAAENLVDYSLNQAFNDHIDANKNIEHLRQSLEMLAKEKKILLFVDELDRCRPNFAISVLKCIKHIFNVEGVKIVLVANNEQLKTSISHCYGMDKRAAEAYLDKFFELALGLPNSFKSFTDAKLAINAGAHFISEVKKYNENFSFLESTPMVSQFCMKLVTHNNLSLRQVEKFVKKLLVYKMLVEMREDCKIDGGVNGCYPIFGVFLSCVRPDLVMGREESEVDFLEVLRCLTSEKDFTDWYHVKESNDPMINMARVLVAGQKHVRHLLEPSAWDKLSSAHGTISPIYRKIVLTSANALQFEKVTAL